MIRRIRNKELTSKNKYTNKRIKKRREEKVKKKNTFFRKKERKKENKW